MSRVLLAVEPPLLRDALATVLGREHQLIAGDAGCYDLAIVSVGADVVGLKAGSREVVRVTSLADLEALL